MFDSALQLSGVSVQYGLVEAVRGVDLVVGRGELVALLGANGAGKSSIVKAVVGIAPVSSGKILINDRDYTRSTPESRAAAGVAYVPEGRRVFADMTVHENLLMGAYCLPGSPKLSLEGMYGLFPRLRERRSQLAGTLSGGEQQMLALGRALVRAPQLLILDEPSLGLAPIMVEVIYQTIADIRRSGISILLAEQSASIALGLADRAYLLETGKVLMTGQASEVARAPGVKAAYLGVDA